MPAEAELWRPILDRFAAAFTDTSGQPGQWQTRLARTVTPFLAEQLTYTDPTRIPTGTVTSIEILAAGAYEVRARVTYTTDLVLTRANRRHRHPAGLAGRRLHPPTIEVRAPVAKNKWPGMPASGPRPCAASSRPGS